MKRKPKPQTWFVVAEPGGTYQPWTARKDHIACWNDFVRDCHNSYRRATREMLEKQGYTVVRVKLIKVKPSTS